MARTASTEQVASSGSEARGDPAGAYSDFGQVYDLHVDFVWRTLRRFGVPDASLDDAVQDVFIVAYHKLGEFEGRSSLRTWIFGIARRVARDHRPAGRVLSVSGERLEALPELAWAAQEATAEQVDAARLLERLLVDLHPEKREAFILVEVEQMTIVEAAEALGVNPNTAYSRLRAARSELEQALGRLEAHSAWRQGCQS
jgi:RNA polymerase sigma-70 factor (ECF subfamily)